MLHPKTEALLKGFLQNPTSTLLIECNSIIDVEIFAKKLESTLLSKNDHNDLHEIHKDATKPLTIEEVRELKTELVHRPTSSSEVARIAIIYKCDGASTEAQNALLKLLEEPPTKTLIVIHVEKKSHVLETIISRCHYIPLLPVTKERARLIADQLHILDSQAIEKAYILASGQAELFANILENKDHERHGAIDAAKTFLSSSVFNRLQLQSDYATAEKLQSLCTGLELVAAAALHHANYANVTKWKTVLKEIKDVKQLLEHNAQVKLAYLQLSTQL